MLLSAAAAVEHAQAKFFLLQSCAKLSVNRQDVAMCCVCVVVAIFPAVTRPFATKRLRVCATCRFVTPFNSVTHFGRKKKKGNLQTRCH